MSGPNKPPRKKLQRDSPFPTYVPEPPPAEISLSVSPLPFVDNLKSVDVKERKKACYMIGYSAFDESTRKLLLERGCLKKLFNLLETEVEIVVIVGAVTAIRNLLVSGDSLVLKEIVANKEYWELIYSIYTKSMGYMASEITESFSHYMEIAVQTLAIFWNLSVCEDDVVTYLYEKNIVSQIMNFMISEMTPENELMLTVAELLAVITDENEECAEQVRSFPSALSTIKKHISSPSTNPFFPLICCAIVYNVRERGDKELIQLILTAVIKPLIECNPTSLIEALYPIVSQENFEADKEFKLQVANCNNIIRSQVTALELLTNICTIDDWSSSPSSQSEDDMECEENYTASFPEELRSCIISTLPFAKLFEYIPPISPQMLSMFDDYKASLGSIVNYLNERQIRTFSCLTNAFQIISPTQIGDVAAMWNSLWSICEIFYSSNTIELLEATIATMRSFLGSCDDYSFVNEKHYNSLNDLSSYFISGTVRAHSIWMLSKLTTKTNNPAYLTALGQILIAKLNDESIMVIIETLNAIFDVFGEDDTQPTFLSLNFLQFLQEFKPKLANRIVQQRFALGEDYSILEDLNNNLLRFIEYKASL